MEEEDLELERLIAEMESERDEEQEEEIDDSEEEESKDEEVSDEEDSEETDDNGDNEEEPDEGSEEGEEDNVDEDEELDDDSDDNNIESFQPVTLDVNGTEVTVTNVEDLVAYARKGASVLNQAETHVEEKLIIDQGKLSGDDLKLLVDAKNGSKEAIAKLAQLGNVDTVDIEDEDAGNYKSQFQTTQVSEVDKVANEISQDADLVDTFQRVSKALPQDFTQKLMSDAGMLKDFARHVKDGIAQEIIPQAMTAQLRDGGSFMDAYTKVGQTIMESKSQKTEQPQGRQVSEKAQKLRQKATSTKKMKPKGKVGGNDIWDLPQADFEKALANGEIDLG